MSINWRTKTIVALGVGLLATSAFATPLPPNDLHLDDDASLVGNISKKDFDRIGKQTVGAYRELARMHGATLEPIMLWKSNKVNAYALRGKKEWAVTVHGGFARQSEMTKDGLVFAICHELGHIFGGYPFFTSDEYKGWDYGNEGSADYFAGHACARKMWSGQIETNSKFRATVDPDAKIECDRAYQKEKDQDLCYRTAMAALPLAKVIKKATTIIAFSMPKYSKKSSKVVSRTTNRHPRAQCRLDTFIAAATCKRDFDETVIPGLDESEMAAKEREAFRYSCFEGSHPDSARPRCWFRPVTGRSADDADTPTDDDTNPWLG